MFTSNRVVGHHCLVSVGRNQTRFSRYCRLMVKSEAGVVPSGKIVPLPLKPAICVRMDWMVASVDVSWVVVNPLSAARVYRLAVQTPALGLLLTPETAVHDVTHGGVVAGMDVTSYV